MIADSRTHTTGEQKTIPAACPRPRCTSWRDGGFSSPSCRPRLLDNREAAIPSAVSNGPNTRPAQIPSPALARRASMMRRRLGAYSPSPLGPWSLACTAPRALVHCSSETARKSLAIRRLDCGAGWHPAADWQSACRRAHAAHHFRRGAWDGRLSLAAFQNPKEMAGGNDLGGLVGRLEVPGVLRNDVVGLGRDSALVDPVVVFVAGYFWFVRRIRGSIPARATCQVSDRAQVRGSGRSGSRRIFPW